ncbi:hypothetical protein Smar_1563 [Staphylothermus marinus F1]|uniref:Uncharacterized protein n=1 Tax=Staphylothermus marinus (strain ATCC 43588 / DSM 3639 / JCM 9404 / F1) TaxID=399550 RepID=A3DPT8_STAMF|nr:hypothetical protein [Staphylothermus marinus]ABN70648.1 hypothetical protein Smar_1563 [Staphylothermus marinus F1]
MGEARERMVELIDVLRRVEDRLLHAFYVRSSISYLYWGIALSGYFIASLIMKYYGFLGKPVANLVFITYWAIALSIIIYEDYRARQYMYEYFRTHLELGGGVSRRGLQIYFIGWCLAAFIGWFLIPIILGRNLVPAGFLVFIGLGNISIYFAARAGYRVSIIPQLVFSILILVLSVPIALIALAGYLGLAWSLAILITILLYLIASLYYINKSLH